MKVFNCFKTSAVFIGTIIGAGFATGREIDLYFGTSSRIVPILAGFIFGLFCYLFLLAGAKGHEIVPTNNGKLLLMAFSLAALIVFTAMVAGANELVKQTFSIRGGGLILATIVAFICIVNADGLKYLNLIIVPSIIVLLFLINSRLNVQMVYPKRYNVFNSLAYVSLNMFLGGFLIVPDGRHMNKKEILFTSVVSSGLILVMILVIHKIVILANHSSMPVLTIASKINLGLVASIIILLAIISTLAGCFTAVSAIFNVKFKSKWVSGLAVLLIGFIGAFFSFKQIVDIGYPIVSVIGIIYTLRVIIASLSKRKKIEKVYIDCKKT